MNAGFSLFIVNSVIKRAHEKLSEWFKSPNGGSGRFREYVKVAQIIRRKAVFRKPEFIPEPIRRRVVGIIAARRALELLAENHEAVFGAYRVKLLVVIGYILAQAAQLLCLPRPRAGFKDAALMTYVDIVRKRQKVLFVRR